MPSVVALIAFIFIYIQVIFLVCMFVGNQLGEIKMRTVIKLVYAELTVTETLKHHENLSSDSTLIQHDARFIWRDVEKTIVI